MRSVELLAPAKDVECGMAAIRYGADAVYIGADKFGARSSAGNSIADVAQLCNYAHTFGAKVYVTVNTIVYDNELKQLEKLLEAIEQSGTDAILVQDMAVLTMMKKRSQMALHASTQTDNRNAKKVAWLHDLGFSRVVLARELSLKEIADIHQKVPDVELEAFVHGALCVSFSGACYASQHCFGRSANRGECAQFCRLRFDVEDDTGTMIRPKCYPLSLKDMCRIDDIEQLLDAGVTSLKIEGRLKGLTYVKNVVSAYSHEIDRIISLHPEKYRRVSVGHVYYDFEPNVSKSFNRGFTNYFLYGRRTNMASMSTPKSIGEYVGTVKELDRKSFTVAGTACFANGDGLCYFDKDNRLEGLRVNKVANNRLFPAVMPTDLHKGTRLFRNYDQAFERLLSKEVAERKIDVILSLSYNEETLRLSMRDESGLSVNETAVICLEKAMKPQAENMRQQLGKLGNTVFKASDINIDETVSQLFIPSNVLADLRRKTVEQLLLKRQSNKNEEPQKCFSNPQPTIYDAEEINVANVSNHIARQFYDELKLNDAPNAYETNPYEQAKTPIMTCRYCLKNELGHCVKHGGKTPTWKEPLRLKLEDGRTFTVEFHCKQCQMRIYAND